VPWLLLISWRAVAGSMRSRNRQHPPSLKLTSQVLYLISSFPPWRRTRARAIWRSISVGWKDKAAGRPELDLKLHLHLPAISDVACCLSEHAGHDAGGGAEPWRRQGRRGEDGRGGERLPGVRAQQPPQSAQGPGASMNSESPALHSVKSTHNS
jgi:hypothetical protein